MNDLQEQAVSNIRRKIEDPDFKSKIEVARLATKEYSRLLDAEVIRKFEDQERRLRHLEEELTIKLSRKIHTDAFNEGYNQAIKDYGIFDKSKKFRKDKLSAQGDKNG